MYSLPIYHPSLTEIRSVWYIGISTAKSVNYKFTRLSNTDSAVFSNLEAMIIEHPTFMMTLGDSYMILSVFFFVRTLVIVSVLWSV